MANVFTGSEIVDIGIQIEKNGKDFYNALISQAKNDEAKEIFTLLAKEEDKHIAIFQKLLETVGKFEPQEGYPGEYCEYMNSLAGEYVFTQKGKGKEAAGRAKDEKAGIDMGIGFEKDSIIFYQGMKKVVPESDKDAIDALIKEEKKHLVKLTRLKKKL